jgi:hypothetical protein
MNELKQWLESNTPDYNAGVLLFAKHSKNRSLLHFFTRKGEKAMSKLRYELGKLAHTIPPVIRKAPPAASLRLKNTKQAKPSLPSLTQERLVIDPGGKIKPEELPKHLRILYYKNVEEYKLLRGAHAAMAVAKTKHERKKYRKQIEKLDDAIAAHWALIDQWLDAGGQLPAAEGQLPTADSQLPTAEGQLPTATATATALTPQEVNAYRTYISRGLAEPDKITAGKRETIQERITALLTGGQKFDDETVAKLTALEFSFE